MFVVSKRNILLPSADGTRSFALRRDFVGNIPDWAADTEYFRALVADGKIGVPQSTKDSAVSAEQDRAPRRRKEQ